jgi:hypothetical protein
LTGSGEIGNKKNIFLPQKIFKIKKSINFQTSRPLRKMSDIKERFPLHWLIFENKHKELESLLNDPEVSVSFCLNFLFRILLPITIIFGLLAPASDATSSNPPDKCGPEKLKQLTSYKLIRPTKKSNNLIRKHFQILYLLSF